MRVKDLAEKNLKQPDAPANQPPSPAKEQDEILDKIRAARGIPQPKSIGPGSVDILGLGASFAVYPELSSQNLLLLRRYRRRVPMLSRQF